MVQLTPCVVVFGGSLGYLITAFPLQVFRRSFTLAFNNDSGEVTDLRIAKQFFIAAGKGFRVFGYIGTIIGLIHVMENLDKPDQLGPGIALAFISLLYGYLLPAFLASPLGDMIGGKLAQHALDNKAA